MKTCNDEQTQKYDYYGIYTACRDAAWRCQLDFDIRRLPVKLVSITNLAGIRVVRNSQVRELRKNESGASIFYNGKWIIVYDDRLDSRHSRMVLAHELGHILLGHVYKYLDYRFASGSRKLKSEREADMFAARLLAPACVLHELQLFDKDKIASLCDIPRDTAAKRARRMLELEKRGSYYLSPLEREVASRFAGFIAEQRKICGGSP